MRLKKKYIFKYFGMDANVDRVQDSPTNHLPAKHEENILCVVVYEQISVYDGSKLIELGEEREIKRRYFHGDLLTEENADAEAKTRNTFINFKHALRYNGKYYVFNPAIDEYLPKVLESALPNDNDSVSS